MTTRSKRRFFRDRISARRMGLTLDHYRILSDELLELHAGVCVEKTDAQLLAEAALWTKYGFEDMADICMAAIGTQGEPK